MRLLPRFLLLLLLTAAIARAAAVGPVTVLPADSLYHLVAGFVDQEGRGFQLAQRRGRPQLVSMFYTSCAYVCPLIVDSAKGVQHALPSAQQGSLDILLVSMDPARDDVAALKSVFARRQLDAATWTLARTDAAAVRKLAALLGVRYRALADGEFNHSSVLVLLDREGRRVASTTRLGSIPDPAFMAAVDALLGQ